MVFLLVVVGFDKRHIRSTTFSCTCSLCLKSRQFVLKLTIFNFSSDSVFSLSQKYSCSIVWFVFCKICWIDLSTLLGFSLKISLILSLTLKQTLCSFCCCDMLSMSSRGVNWGILFPCYLLSFNLLGSLIVWMEVFYFFCFDLGWIIVVALKLYIRKPCYWNVVFVEFYMAVDIDSRFSGLVDFLVVFYSFSL